MCVPIRARMRPCLGGCGRAAWQYEARASTLTAQRFRVLVTGGCSKIGSEGNGTRATLGLVAAHPCMLRMLLRSKQSSTESAHARCICPIIDRYVLSHRSLVDDYCMCMLQEGVRGTLHVM